MKKIVFLLFISVSMAQAKLVSVQFSDEVCSCKGFVETSILSPKQLQTAMNWGLEGRADLTLWPTLSPMKKTELQKAKSKDEKSLLEYEKKINNAILPKMSDWEAYRTEELQNLRLDRYLQLGSFNYLIDGKVETLLEPFEKEAIPEKCRSYAEALTDEPKIRSTAHKLKEEVCSQNGNHSSCLKETDDAFGAADSLRQMKAYVLTFGWRNCVNKQFRKEENGGLSKSKEKLKSQVKKLKCECDQP